MINADTKALYPYDDLELGDTTGERLDEAVRARALLRQPADRVGRVRHVRRDEREVGGDQAERVRAATRVTSHCRLRSPSLREGAGPVSGRPPSRCPPALGLLLFFAVPLGDVLRLQLPDQRAVRRVRPVDARGVPRRLDHATSTGRSPSTRSSSGCAPPPQRSRSACRSPTGCGLRRHAGRCSSSS